MKKTYIIALGIIAIAIGVIISTAGDASTYVSFTEAEEMAAEGDNEKVHVVGILKKDEQKNIVGMSYNPAIDPNYFEFILIDNNNKEKKVVYSAPKPQDFDRSEQVVVIGSVKNDVFLAEKILMKCPSKYQETEIKENA